MLYLNQTRYGPRFGNCFMTCVACLLEKQVYQLPDNEGGDPLKLQEYLKTIGLNYIEFKLDKIYSILPKRFIVIGQSPRFSCDHAAIADQSFKLIWDPHPSRAGIKDFKIVGIIFKEI